RCQHPGAGKRPRPQYPTPPACGRSEALRPACCAAGALRPRSVVGYGWQAATQSQEAGILVAGRSRIAPSLSLGCLYDVEDHVEHQSRIVFLHSVTGVHDNLLRPWAEDEPTLLVLNVASHFRPLRRERRLTHSGIGVLDRHDRHRDVSDLSAGCPPVLLPLQVVTAAGVWGGARVCLPHDPARRIPKWSAVADEDHACDLLGMSESVARRDVPAA